MATDTLRVGIIGAGANTRSRHIPGLRMQNSVEIVGVANRSMESSQKAAKELDKFIHDGMHFNKSAYEKEMTRLVGNLRAALEKNHD